MQTAARAVVASNLRALPAAEPVWDHDPAAERAVLGAVLLDEAGEHRVWERVSAILTARDFHLQAHVVLFEAMERLAARGEPVDVITLCNELRAMDRINTVGGAQYVGELTDYIPVTSHCEVHARLVLDHSARRKAAAIGRGLAVRAHDLSRPIGATLAGAVATIEAVPLPAVEAPTLAADVVAYFAILDGTAPRSAPPVPTGLADLDGALRGGLRMGSYILLGLSGTGKTTLAAQWTAHVALHVGWVLFISKEENRDRLRDALLAHLSRIPYAKVERAREYPEDTGLTQDDVRALTAAANVLHGLRLRVMDPSTDGCPNTVAEVVAVARAMNPRPVAVFIDNLGELSTRGQYGARTDLATEEKMKDLRRAKNLLKVPIVTLAHPTGAARSGNKPRRVVESDIAGGQPAARICDGVIIMHREDKHPTRDHAKEPATPGGIELYSGKVRGLSHPLYCEALAIPAQHRFASMKRPAADGAPPGRASSAPVTDEGEGLPLDEVPPFPGEQAHLALAPGGEDLGPQYAEGGR